MCMYVHTYMHKTYMHKSITLIYLSRDTYRLPVNIHSFSVTGFQEFSYFLKCHIYIFLNIPEVQKLLKYGNSEILSLCLYVYRQTSMNGYLTLCLSKICLMSHSVTTLEANNITWC